MPDAADIPPIVAMLLTAGMLTLLAASIGMWQYLARCMWRGVAVLPSAPRRPVPWTGPDLLIVLLLSIVTAQPFLLAVSEVASESSAVDPEGIGETEQATGESIEDDEPPADPAEADDEPKLTLASFMRWATFTSLAMCLAVVYLKWRRSPTRQDFGVPSGFVAHDIALGVKAFVAAVVPVYGLQIVLAKFFPAKHPLSEAMLDDPSWQMVVSGAVLAVVVAPIAEEFFFRVLFQGWLESAERRWGQNWSLLARLPAGVLPILVSSFVFGLAHGGHGPDPIPIFMFALVLGYLYHRTHRYLPCVVLHACLNGISVVLMIVLILSGNTAGL